MALYYNILYLMVRDYRETEAAQEEIQDSRRLDALSKITTYMREHYTEELKLSEMANLIWLFRRLFVANVQKVCKNQF